MTTKDITYSKTETGTNWRIKFDEVNFFRGFSICWLFESSQCMGLHTW